MLDHKKDHYRNLKELGDDLVVAGHIADKMGWIGKEQACGQALRYVDKLRATLDKLPDGI